MKKWFKYTLYIILIVFILFNVLINVQVYHITHFTADKEHFLDPNIRSGKSPSIWKILTGIKLSKSVNTDTLPIPHENIKIQSNVLLDAWYTTTDSAKGTVLIFHGYNNKKSANINKILTFDSLGYNTLTIDFMGCGDSEGYYSTIGYLEAQNVKDAYEYIVEKGEKNIIFNSMSMGSVSVMKAIQDYDLKPNKIIIEGPFGTFRETFKNRIEKANAPSFPLVDLFLFWFSVQNQFWAYNHNPDEYAKSINIPTLLMIGSKDPTIKMQEIDRIYSNLKTLDKKKVVFEDSKHELYCKSEHDKWVNEIEEFLN